MGAIMVKRLLLASLLGLSVSTCTDQRSHTQAVYMLIDTSGTYAAEVGKAQRIINYLLGTLQSGDSLAVARLPRQDRRVRQVGGRQRLHRHHRRPYPGRDVPERNRSRKEDYPHILG